MGSSAAEYKCGAKKRRPVPRIFLSPFFRDQFPPASCKPFRTLNNSPIRAHAFTVIPAARARREATSGPSRKNRAPLCTNTLPTRRSHPSGGFLQLFLKRYGIERNRNTQAEWWRGDVIYASLRPAIFYGRRRHVQEHSHTAQLRSSRDG